MLPVPAHCVPSDVSPPKKLHFSRPVHPGIRVLGRYAGLERRNRCDLWPHPFSRLRVCWDC